MPKMDYLTTNETAVGGRPDKTSTGGAPASSNSGANNSTATPTNPNLGTMVDPALAEHNITPATGAGHNTNLAGSVDPAVANPTVQNSLAPSTQTTYIDANGQQQTGYIINGTTYTDPTGKNPVGVGSIVNAGGTQYIKTANGSMKYSDWLAQQGSGGGATGGGGGTTSGGGTTGGSTGGSTGGGYTNTAANALAADAEIKQAQQSGGGGQTGANNGSASNGSPFETVYIGPDGKPQKGYIINGKTYTDAAGTSEVPIGSTVRDQNGKAWKKGENGSQLVYSPDDNDYYYADEVLENAKGGMSLAKGYTSAALNNTTGPYWVGEDSYRTGNISTRASGGYWVYDGKQNPMGYFDSAGTWHPNGDANDDLYKSWEQTARKYFADNGITFTGNGQNHEGKIFGGITRGEEDGSYIGTNKEHQYFHRDPFSNIDVDYVLGGSTGSYSGGGQYPTGGMGKPNGQTETNWFGPGTPSPGTLPGETTRSYPGTPAPPQSAASPYGISNEQLTALLAGLNSPSGGAPSANYAISNEQIAQLLSGLSGTDAGGGATINPGPRPDVPQAPDLKPMLDEWRTNEETRQQNMIDYETNRGIDALNRAQEDAQAGFRESQEQIARDEMAARDNQALYAEARGDKGGIGAAQYDSIANTAAINRQAVRDSQTKLATDTARQIEDLRSQGEFKKADALLQVSQEYLSNLMSLEQWAANYGLNAAQFEEAMREWEQNFQLNVAQITGELNGQKTLAARNADRDYAMNLMNYDLNRTNADRNYELNALNSNRDWAMNLMNYDLNRTNADRNYDLEKTNADRNFGLSEANVTGYYNGRPTYAKTNADRSYELEKTNADRNFALNEANITGMYNGLPTYSARKNEESQLASAGSALLNAGIMPSADQLKAMGMSSTDAQALLMAAQAKKTSGGGYYSGATPIDNGGNTGYEALFSKANELYPNNPDLAMAWIKQMSKAQLSQYGLSSAPSDTYLQNGYSTWLNAKPTYVDNNKISDDAKSLLSKVKGITGTGRQAEYIDQIATEANSNYDLSENDVKWLYQQIGYGDYYQKADSIKGKTWDPALQKFV